MLARRRVHFRVRGEHAPLGSPWRVATICRTNVQTAYNAGRYAQQSAMHSARPYWQYLAVLDERTRPSCCLRSLIHSRLT